MIIPPSITAIFDLFPRKARFAKEQESPEFTAGKKLGYEEGKRDAYKQMINNSAGLSIWEHEELTNFLVSRGLVLTYDLMNGGFSVRRAKYGTGDPYTYLTPPLITEEMTQLPSTRSVPHLKVTARLKSQQRIDSVKWVCTIKGEQKIIRSQLVCFYVTKHIDAFKAVNIDEIEDIRFD